MGAGNVGGFIVEELLKQKATGAIEDIVIITRPVCAIAPFSHSNFPLPASALTSLVHTCNTGLP